MSENLSLYELFQAHLFQLGYQVEQDNPIFALLLEHFKCGAFYRVVETEFLPILQWDNPEIEALLAPYQVMRGV